MHPHRRGFIQALLCLPGVGPLLEWLAPSLQAAAPGGRDVYRELGVRPLINAAGTYTTLGGSLPRPEVLEAMQSASRQFVNLGELHQAVGQRIAARAGCEAALVTAGAASALTLATAACVAGKDAEKIRRLPDTAGMKNEVIIQKAHRYGYDHAVRNVGVKLIEVESRADLEKAVGERTALMLFFNDNDPIGKIHVEEFAELGRKLKVPTLNDAAAEIPPAENLSRFLKMGYDLVTFSGGKGLRGPQSTGLLLGRKDLIEAAALNNNPHTDSIGRTNKVDKEDIVGMWAALEAYLKEDHAAVWKEWEARVRTIATAVGKVQGVKTETFVPPIANRVPHLRITWDVSLRKPAEVVKQLREGEPKIEVRPLIADGIEVSTWMLEPGQAEIVGQRLAAVLAGR
ncbi:MAG: aminotransferase class V-fold PLP-dependent enzyme [Planctomycetia bacterium]|nr:aminotransferase class V-fold PLP-dependent enzyme [Planctomycetia bacterium]